MPRIIQAAEDGIERAISVLRDGGVVAFPTETVYGLGADTFNAKALERIYTLKGRPDDNPLIAHVGSVSIARTLVQLWDDRCEALAARFWPGPLTLILPKQANVPAQATAGLDTIALRCPDHPVARDLLEAFGGAISAPSANRSGHISPTKATHVEADFAPVEDLLILDGGSCEIGVESTVLDLSGAAPTILRPGRVGDEELHEILHDVRAPLIETQTSSPGSSLTHYAPHTRTILVESKQLVSTLATMSEGAVVLCFDPTQVHSPHITIEMPRSADAYARALYDAMRRADIGKCIAIVIERPAQTDGLWSAVQDRLKRATART